MKDVLIRTLGGEILYRAYDGAGGFTNCRIRHDDLPVTIDEDALAAIPLAPTGNAIAAVHFLSPLGRGGKIDGRDVLDHSPEVLVLNKLPAGNRA